MISTRVARRYVSSNNAARNEARDALVQLAISAYPQEGDKFMKQEV